MTFAMRIKWSFAHIQIEFIVNEYLRKLMKISHPKK